MFESWLEQEKATIKSRFGTARIIGIVFTILIIPFFLISIVSLLDGGGIGSLAVIVFDIFTLILILSLCNYKKRFVEPLLASIEQELSTEAKRQEFAQQMLGQSVCISYQPLPQVKSCDMMVAKDYCYMRQPKKSCIIQNSQIRRIIFSKEQYTVGSRGHIRWCYALALYTSDIKKPIWKGYFMDKNAASQTLLQFQAVLPPEVAVEDFVANPEKVPKEPVWKLVLEWVLCILVFIGLYFIAKYLK